MDELEEMISEDITLDSRVHARIIGARGKGIRKIMDEFKVRLLRGNVLSAHAVWAQSRGLTKDRARWGKVWCVF